MSAGGGRAGSGDGRAGAEGGVNFDESQLSVRTKIQILKEKLAVLQRTVKNLRKLKLIQMTTRSSFLRN